MTDRPDRRAPVEGDPATTVVEQVERNPAAARELAAARLATGIVWALNEALRSRSWQAKQLADALGVGESAVSQVLNGDGNVRVATIGRYGRALGYQPRLVLEPVESGLAPIVEPAPRRRRARRDVAPQADRVALPQAGWHVVSALDGGTWAVQTTVSWPTRDRMLQESAYTRLESVPTEAAVKARSVAPTSPGGGA